jgi:hypothetical protein
MNAADLPLVGLVVRTGADDRVYDTAMVVGVLLLAGIAALGRTMLTEALVVAYLVAFSGYICYNGLGGDGEDVESGGTEPGRERRNRRSDPGRDR